MRVFFVIHRWAGITSGLMAFVWFVSGIVVHWYAFVDATDVQRLRGYGAPLTPAALRGIQLPPEAAAGATVLRAVLHRVAGKLAWETETTRGVPVLIDARSGERRGGVTIAEATAIAQEVVNEQAVPIEATLTASPDAYYYEQSFRYEFTDQETFPLPVYRITFPAPRRLAVYVDPSTGRVVAVVGSRQRMTRLFGTLPHFLNPAFLHGHGTLHLTIMIVLLFGAFVSGASGLTYGVWFLWRQRRARSSEHADRRRPLRRLIADWHNWIGVVVGAFVITWVVSGSLMLWYPEVTPDAQELERLEAGTIGARDYRVSPDSALLIATRATGTPILALQARRLLTRPVYDARHTDGRSTLVDGLSGVVLSPLPDSLVRAVVQAYFGRVPGIRAVSFLDHYDAYYYNLHGRLRPLPVYRVDLIDGDTLPSPLYIDALRGELTGRVDGKFRTFRWFGSALHTMDFPALFFHPIAWHLVLVGLALLGALLSGSGLWLGLTYLRRLAPGVGAGGE